eukprot:Rhum_TRINITY_DN8230_c0_g1::Rhum_TRINITY_DN8230_c0_g1_i1::g.26854::m.26854
MSVTEATMCGTVAEDKAEELVLLAEGLSGFDAVWEATHELLLSADAGGADIRLRRTAQAEDAASALSALDTAGWQLQRMGQRSTDVKEAVVRAYTAASFPHGSCVSGAAPLAAAPGVPTPLLDFLGAAGFAVRAGYLACGPCVALPRGLVLRVYELRVVDTATHDVAAARAVGPGHRCVRASVSATPQQLQHGRGVPAMLKALSGLAEAIQHLTVLQSLADLWLR